MSAVGLILAWGPLAFGSVYAWAYIPLLLLCAVVGLAGLRRPRPSDGQRRASMCLVLIAVFIICQLVPVPFPVLDRVSPATVRYLLEKDFRYVVFAARGGDIDHQWHATSIRPDLTLVALCCFSALSLFLVGLMNLLTTRVVDSVTRLLTILGGLMASIALVQASVLGRGTIPIYGFWHPEGEGTVFGPFVNGNHFAGWMLLALPICIGSVVGRVNRDLQGRRFTPRQRLFWIASPEGSKTIVAGVAILLMVVSLVFSLSRSGALGFGVAMAFGFGVALRKRYQGVTRLLLLLAIVGVAAAVTAVLRSEDLVRTVVTTQWATLGDRKSAWEDTIRIFRDFPILGCGMNTFGAAMLKYENPDSRLLFVQAHNDYLQVAAEGGAILIALVVWTIRVIARAASRRLNDGGDDVWSSWVRLGALTSCIAIATQALFDFSLQMPGNAALFVVVLALALHEPRSGAFVSVRAAR